MNTRAQIGRFTAVALITWVTQWPGALAAAQGSSDSLELLVAPQNGLIAQEARTSGLGYHGVSPYYDLVLQTIFVINRSSEPLTIEGGSIELLSAGRLVQTTALSVDEFSRTQAKAAALKAMKFDTGLEVLYSAISTLPPGTEIAPTVELASGSAGLVDDYYLIARELPDEVRIAVWASAANGQRVSADASFPVRQHVSANQYIFPLEAGEWFIMAFPGLKSHHRWTAATEHGIDITMVDHRGSWAAGDADTWRTGRVPQWEDWYAYNKKVLAAADGVVVKVSDDVVFPLEFWNRYEEESADEYQGRIGARQMELFMAPGADGAAVAGGNYVLIEHENGEYSYYAHLAYGKVRVKVGQRVKQGEHIAGLGGTGEMPAVHLHFQISDGPSMMNSRTLPVRFNNTHINEPFSAGFEPKVVFQSGYFIHNC